MAYKPLGRMGPPPRSFAADAHDCIMVRVHTDRPNTSLWRDSPRPHGELPSDRPHRTSAGPEPVAARLRAVGRRQPAARRKLTQQGPADRVSALDTSGPIQVLRAIVLPQSLLMKAGQAQVPESRSVGAELVGSEQFRREALFLEELAHQPDCRPLVAPALNQHVENLALVVDGAPQVHPFASNPDHHLVEVPSITLASAAPPQLSGAPGRQFHNP